MAREVDAALDAGPDPRKIAQAYTQGDPSWCVLDTLHRHIEKRASSPEFALLDQPEELDALVTAARRRYAETAGRLAEAFVRGLAAADFELPGYYRQTQVFEMAVAPRLPGRRVAYVLVDALRYELARELVDLLGREFEAHLDLEVVIGTMPSITEVGLAALMPRAGAGLAVRPSKKTLQVAIGDCVLSCREDRIEYLRQNAGVPLVALKLEEPKQFRRKLRELGDGPGLVVLTSREIDRAGEEGLSDARRLMEDVLAQLRLALRHLAEAGMEYIVVATDHGYLFGEELSEAEKMDPPGRSTVLLHRRVWAGEGGAASESYLRARLSRLGVASELEIAVP